MTVHPVVGTWKLKSQVREILDTGEKIAQFSARPSGYAILTPDGRIMLLLLHGNRQVPKGAAATDAEAAALYRSLCPPSAIVRRKRDIEQGRISGSSLPLRGAQIRQKSLPGKGLRISECGHGQI